MTAKRFWARVRKQKRGCWLWCGGKQAIVGGKALPKERGYGRVYIKNGDTWAA